MKNFNEIYEQVYKTSGHELETLRKTKMKKTMIFVVIAIIAIVIVISIGISSATGSKGISGITSRIYSVQIIMFTFVPAMFIIIFAFAKNSSKLTMAFKEKVIEPFIKNIDKNLNYSPNGKMPSVIYRRGEFEMFDRYFSEDLISGKLDNKYKITIAEIHTQDESVDSKGHRHVRTLFYGIFGNMECTKNIGTTIKIHSDKGFLGKMFESNKKVEMDSIEFEKHFDVYGDDKIKTMQILTADVMAMMLDFQEKHKIRYEITLKDNQVYIRFHTGEVFEPNMFKSTLDYNMLKRYYDIIEFVFNISKEINKVIENTEV